MAVERIELPKAITMGVGETRALVPVLTPGDANEPLKYTSGKAKIVAVSADGVLTAKKVGTAKITVKSEGGKKAAVKITVLKKPTKLKLKQTAADLPMSETLRLQPVFAAKTGGGVTYSSSDPAIATVDDDGLVTGAARGSATVTACTYNGKLAECRVNVFFDVSTMMSDRADDRPRADPGPQEVRQEPARGRAEKPPPLQHPGGDLRMVWHEVRRGIDRQ